MPKYTFETVTLGQKDTRIITARNYEQAVNLLYSTYPETGQR